MTRHPFLLPFKQPVLFFFFKGRISFCSLSEPSLSSHCYYFSRCRDVNTCNAIYSILHIFGVGCLVTGQDNLNCPSGEKADNG